MSTDILSEEEERDPPEVEKLLKEMKMKELALKKATNLIELLNIEVPPRLISWKSRKIPLRRALGRLSRNSKLAMNTNLKNYIAKYRI